MKLELSYPPSTNALWRYVRGRVLKSEAARQYATRARHQALSQGARPLDGDVSVSIVAYRPARRGDIDNLLKSALDALRGVAFQDDRQVAKLAIERFEDADNPRLEVLVVPREPW